MREESSRARQEAIQGKGERVRQRCIVARQTGHYQEVGVSLGCCREGVRQKLEEHAGDGVGQSSRQERRSGSRFFRRSPPVVVIGLVSKWESANCPDARSQAVTSIARAVLACSSSIPKRPIKGSEGCRVSCERVSERCTSKRSGLLLSPSVDGRKQWVKPGSGVGSESALDPFKARGR